MQDLRRLQSQIKSAPLKIQLTLKVSLLDFSMFSQARGVFYSEVSDDLPIS